MEARDRAGHARAEQNRVKRRTEHARTEQNTQEQKRDAFEILRAVVKQNRTRKIQEADKSFTKLQKDVREVKAQRDSVTFLEKEVDEQRDTVSFLEKEVAHLRQVCDALSTLAQDVAELQKWMISEEQQEVFTRLTKLEARLSEASLPIEHNDVEIPEPSHKDAEVLSKSEGAVAAVELPEPTRKDAEVLSKRACAVTAIEIPRTYTFEESVYDAVFFLFSEHMSVIPSCFIGIGFLLNMVMQIQVIAMLILQFTDDPFEEPYLKSLKEWRQSEGQSYLYADILTGVSLTARVCAEDSGLSLSTAQVNIITEARLYLENDSGLKLGIVAILLWILTCAWELRKAIQFALALLNLQVTAETVFSVDSDGLHLLSLSLARLLVGFSIILCRSTIAVFLMIYGSWWLAYTTSTKDLLLNASALGFVLDIDEVVFGVVAPATISGIMSSMQPLRLPKGVMMVPGVMTISVAASVILVEVFLSQHIRTSLRDAQDILCSENTEMNFILGTTEAGWLVSAQTVPFLEAATDLVHARRTAAQLLIDKAPEAVNYSEDVSHLDRSQNVAELRRRARQKFEELVDEESCQDISGTELSNRLFAITGIPSVRNATSCIDVADYCRGAPSDRIPRIVRMWCPITCGCAAPMSGFWALAMTYAGCPWKACQLVLSKATFEDKGKCEDTPLTDLRGNSNWTFMLAQMRVLNVINTSVFNNLSSIGCPAFRALPYITRQKICGTSDPSLWNADQSGLGAGFMCPESCACIYPYLEGPEVHYGQSKYIPGGRGLCPRVACAEKYRGYAQEYCMARGLQVVQVETAEGVEVVCDNEG